MKLLTPNVKMADVIHSNYLLIPVVNRFGIPLGFGENTIRTVCTEHGIDIDFFLSIINAFSNENYFPEKKMQTFNVLMIVEYLKKTHKYYREVQIPIIEKHLKVFLQGASSRNKSLQLLKKFFLVYKKELLTHLKYEETITFPYIEEVYRLYNSQQKNRKQKSNLNYSMKMYEAEHDEVDDKLYDLKNILIKYISGNFDEVTCNTIIFELFRLEKDIMDHARIETNILLPLVTEMEKSLNLKKV
ncbi:MAG: hemerythrin domain-containing protein [Ignavibacteriales bacterium]|nr:hemerythrin domain-containing protein [Ignavibacteriales bacterium]